MTSRDIAYLEHDYEQLSLRIVTSNSFYISTGLLLTSGFVSKNPAIFVALVQYVTRAK